MKRPDTATTRARSSFNSDFRFLRGDPDGAGDSLDYAALRPFILHTGSELISEGLPKPAKLDYTGATPAFAEPAFDDSAWRKLDVPHDYGIEGPFSQELPGETGKLPWHGPAWYRKRFIVDASARGKRVELDVDGAMAFSVFFLNGKLIGGWPYGYSSFRLDLTPHLDFEGENVLAVRLNNPPNSSRWYPGAGLYRNLWLEISDPVRVAHWGVFVSCHDVGKKRARVHVDVTFENLSNAEVELTLSTALYELDAAGHIAGSAVADGQRFEAKLGAGIQALRTHSIELKKPKLWSLSDRRRYAAVSELRAGTQLLDRVTTPFGVRSARFDAERGFFLNDERVPLNGVCMHHDLGALGAALHVPALARQLKILQEMGCNAIRTSHNPPAPELLELADEMGFLLLVEAFDCWRRGKKWPDGLKEGDPGYRYFDYAPLFDDWHERDLRAMLRRDRNHPSVIAWSIGNEVMEQWQVDGWKLSTRLAGIVREEDRTRPTTSAFNGELAGYSGYQTAIDLIGYNYKPEAYATFHASNPTLPVFGAETASSISSRGEYFFPVSDDKHHGKVNFQVSSYDLSAARWAFIPDLEFKGLDESPFAAGEFVWTGFDYLGEPTPYNSDATNLLNFSDPDERARMAEELARLGAIRVPSRSSYFGIIDLAGFPKDRFYIYQARWRPNFKMAHILPHWTWPERVGEVTPVHVYSTGDEAELFLNGKSQGKRARKRLKYRFRWDDVVYEPGKLEVVVKRNGKKWARALQRTAGAATNVSLGEAHAARDREGRNYWFVSATICDARGVRVPRAKSLVQFALEGPAEILAVDNGDPTSFEPFQASTRTTFNGLALAVVRARSSARELVTLHARTEGLSSATLTLKGTG